ncbi:MAG TPA: VOC family protein [Candidatus Binataceae bacterium]|nr:VOC family protein [Candidatus Binataceae bacterium]
MNTMSPLSLLGMSLHQVAFAVRDMDAAQKFFNEKMGVPRFLVLNKFSESVTEKMYHGKPANSQFKIALAYSGETQLELCQHISGDTIYKDFLDKRGEGLHHLGFFMDDKQKHDKALADLIAQGYPVLMSGRLGELSFTYLDTEAAIGSIMELVYIDQASKAMFAKIKSGDF